jgi:hypothetical protein
MTRADFRKFVSSVSGDRPSEPAYPVYRLRSVKREESPYTRDQAAEIAECLIQDRRRHIANINGVADVIDELTDMQLKGMQDQDYKRVRKIRDVISSLRTTFRDKDRKEFHETRVRDLKTRMHDAEQAVKECQEEWKAKESEFKQDCKQEQRDLDAKHDAELGEMTANWRDESWMRRFAKRSPMLLNQMVREKKMALLGDLWNVEVQMKMNKKSERIEVEERSGEYQSSFENARAQLLRIHEEEIQALKESEAFRWQWLLKCERDAIEVRQKHLAAVKSILEDEGNISNFMAKQFKHPYETVLPMTVSLAGGDDIPAKGKTRSEWGDNGKMSAFRDSNSFEPLTLPPLKVRKVKKPRAYVKKKKGSSRV